MCGFVVVAGKKLEAERINKALYSIRHRGPDESGIWQSQDGQISFGHARLSIIDLASGLQPFTNHDQSIVAVVNGEFYDYEAIREELQSQGYKFKTKSDSEILLGLYERYGTRCFKKLRGEFAFVLWDAKNRLIFAARDYFGIKPLFYTVDKEAIYFASEAKALKELGIPLELDEENFFQTLNFFPLPDTSLFKNVYQVPPAHFLIKSAYSTQPRVHSYWDFNYPMTNASIAELPEEEIIHNLRELLKQSVKLRLRADVPVACYLSGGLDSCSILGVAQHLSEKPVHAFTLTFEHGDYNEAAQAEEMAAFVKAPFHPIAINQDAIAHHMEDAVWHAERFMNNGHGVAKYLLSREVQKAGFKVVLTGEGSDEIFGGYAHFRQDQIIYDQQRSLAEKESLLDMLKKTNKVSAAGLMGESYYTTDLDIEGMLGYLPSWVRGFRRHKDKLLELLSASTRRKLGQRNPVNFAFNALDIAGQVEGRDLLSGSLYLWSRTILPYYLLTILGDRMEMAHSVEGRVPFLDHRLVEYVVKMPSRLKIHDLVEKYALREAAKPFITKTIYERQKHPFLAPPAFLSSKKNLMSVLIEDTLRSTTMQKIPYIDQKGVIALLDNYDQFSEDEKAKYDLLLMSLTSACMLQKRLGG